MSDRKFDVVVVGAGPAGSLAALILSREGKSVALLDKAEFPREKVCGDGLNPNCWAIWRRQGLEKQFIELPHHDLAGFCLELNGKKVFEKTFPFLERSVRRSTLDAWLCTEAQKQGALFSPRTNVTFVNPDGLVTTSDGEFQGSFVLGADGRNSVVADKAGLSTRATTKCTRIAWEAHVDPTVLGGLDDNIHLNVFREGHCGYCRSGPGTATLNFVLKNDSKPGEVAHRYFPNLPDQAWQSINPLTRPPNSPGKGRIWLIGDAARVLEPFTGEGISSALATGEAAAQSVLKAMEEGSPELGLEHYKAQRKKIYGNRTWVNTFLAWTMEDPTRGVLITRFLSVMPGAISGMFDQIYTSADPNEPLPRSLEEITGRIGSPAPRDREEKPTAQRTPGVPVPEPDNPDGTSTPLRFRGPNDPQKRSPRDDLSSHPRNR